MIRLGVIGVVAVLALWAGLASHAGAATLPSLADAQYRVSVLDGQLADANAQVQRREAAVTDASAQLEQAADRVAALTDEPFHLVTPWEIPAASRASSRLAAARAQLARVEQRITHARKLPGLIAAEHRLRRVKKLRARAAAVVSTIQQAALADRPVQVTRGAWATALLQAIGAPTCQNNMVSLVAWQTAENTRATFNPLATTMPAGRAGTFNSSGVKNYASLLDGINATVQTLQAGYATFGYGWILYRLGRCDPPEITAGAINASSWCKGCAGGRYVTGIIPLVAADYETYERL